MKISILNEVLGPILHGPSSSHTAASYSIGRLTHMLCEDEIKEINITFDSKGSFFWILLAECFNNFIREFFFSKPFSIEENITKILFSISPKMNFSSLFNRSDSYLSPSLPRE
ncbi:unnamed protein product [marine sediment metagenome]|uniref:Serine dehydratase beta chain domain-containing protein n=1 Tax=marine sediment metagenome TaxID=412755 RepID=X1J068_9ZZZZ